MYYVTYSTNKELIEYSRIPLQNICNYTPTTDIDTTQNIGNDTLQTGGTEVQQTERIKDYTRLNTPRNANHLYKIYDSKGRYTSSRQEKPTNIRKGLFVK